MTIEEALKEMGELIGSDPEIEHAFAEAILCDYLRDNGAKELAEAFEAARDRCGFWYA